MNLDDIINIIIGVAIVDGLFMLLGIHLEKRKEAKKKAEVEKQAKKAKKLDIGCDYCEEVKKLYQTPDKEFSLCKACMEGYFNEHPEITEEQKAKVRAKYRANKRRRKPRR